MSEAEIQDSSDEFWLFGYGYAHLGEKKVMEECRLTVASRSLIWKPPPHYGMYGCTLFSVVEVLCLESLVISDWAGMKYVGNAAS